MPEPNDLSAILFFAPDVILLDEFINRKTGQRLCRKIKQVLKLVAKPVIILSTGKDNELIATGCDANDYFSKHFNVKDMFVKIMRMVDHQPLAY
jgi:two-component system phosphate regulon response regulator PhoB